jgi:TonB-linked SusC/RagA family outer membrane protein
MKQTLKEKSAFLILIECVMVLLIFLLNTHNLNAQKVSITGTVTDQITGESLAGANVLIKGTMIGTVTDAEGLYSIDIYEPGVLVFSFIGYQTVEVMVSNQTVVDVSLLVLAEDLEEIVVVGYGVQKKKLSTGANVHVEDEDIEKRHSLRIEQALQGLSPGVSITANTGQPGEALKVRIRGVGTVGNSDPLYVIDGVPTEDIRYLNPSDVESVDILKDAASAAIYGARAANGVVLITTKKGEVGKMRVSYDGYYGWQNTPKKPEMLNGRDYMMIMNEISFNSARDTSRWVPVFSDRQIDSIGEGTNWIDYLFNDDAPVQSHTVSISGGNEISVFSSSLSYYDQAGIIGYKDRSNFERISSRINSEHKAYGDILKIGENIVYSHSKVNGIGIGNMYVNSLRSFANATPIYTPYSDTTDDGFGLSPYTDDVNPLAALYYEHMGEYKYDQVVGNIYAELEVIKGLKIRSDFGIDLAYKSYNFFQPIYTLAAQVRKLNTMAEQSLEKNLTYNIENYITYSRTFLDRHNIIALFGNTIQEYRHFLVRGQKDDLIFDDFDYAILDNGTNEETQVTYGTKLDRAMLSYYGRLNYNFDEKYLFAFTLRRDGSSKFGPENRWGYFPSVSIGWVLTEEDFFDLESLGFFKLRGSWGQNGNDRIPDFMYEATIQSTQRDYFFGPDEIQFVGASPDKINNTKLKWETSEQVNIGFDLRFFNNFSLSFDWYKKLTKDWLIQIQVPDIAGNEAPYANGGDVENKGFEVDFGYRKIQGDLTYRLNVNLAYNKNEVTKINNEEGIIHGPEGILFHGHTEIYRAEVGYPIGYFYGYKALGIFQTEEDIQNHVTIIDEDTLIIQSRAVPGDVKFADIGGRVDSLGNQFPDGTIDGDDRTVIGNPHPKFIYGLSFSAEYKGFDISVTAQGVAGNDIIYNLRNHESATKNYTTEILDRWHGPGTSNDIPRVTKSNEPNQNYKKVSDMLFIFSGSYLKIRNINIGYDLARTLLKNRVEQCRIYVSANNIFTITRYPGLDPEVGYGDYDIDRYENFSTGIDIGYYPIPRSYYLGVNIKF